MLSSISSSLCSSRQWETLIQSSSLSRSSSSRLSRKRKIHSSVLSKTASSVSTPSWTIPRPRDAQWSTVTRHSLSSTLLVSLSTSQSSSAARTDSPSTKRSSTRTCRLRRNVPVMQLPWRMATGLRSRQALQSSWAMTSSRARPKFYVTVRSSRRTRPSIRSCLPRLHSMARWVVRSATVVTSRLMARRCRLSIPSAKTTSLSASLLHCQKM